MEIEYWGIVVDGVGLLVMVVVAFLIYKLTRKILKRIDKNVLIIMEGDTVEAPTDSLVAQPVAVRTEIVTATISHLPMSKAAAQKRLDEDTKRVGWVRGEIYPLEDGSWAIHWGGKYRL